MSRETKGQSEPGISGVMVSSCATIVIPVLNQPREWLDQSVRSSLGQTTPCETVVVTSPETDPTTLAFLARLARRQESLRVLPEEGLGFAAALNTGIRAAVTGRVGFLLSDDWLDERAAESCLRFDTDIVSTGMRCFAGDGRRVLWSISRSPSLAEFHSQPSLERKACYLQHFLLFNREKLLEVGGIDESVGVTGPDDFDLPWTLLERGASVSIVREQLYNYRDHTAARLTLRNAVEQIFDLIKILDKHGVQGEGREEIVRRHSLSYGRPYHVSAELREPRTSPVFLAGQEPPPGR